MTVPSLILRLERLPEQSKPIDGPAAVEPPTPLRRVVDLAGHERSAAVTHPLARWSDATAAAHDACLVLDPDGAVVSISAAAAELLGCSDAGVVGHRLLEVIDVVDLDAYTPNPEYADRIPPLAVLGGRGLMRSLMRVRHSDDALVTVDVSSAPIHDVSGAAVGSMSFLAVIASL